MMKTEKELDLLFKKKKKIVNVAIFSNNFFPY